MNKQQQSNSTTTNTNTSTVETTLLQQAQLMECLEKLDLILANQGQLKNIIVSQVSIISGNASGEERGNENGNASASASVSL